jgi:hypothetical protein
MNGQTTERQGVRARTEPAVGSVVVGMPGFEPHQPVPSRPGVYVVVCLTCMFTTDVCCNVRVDAHRL